MWIEFVLDCNVPEREEFNDNCMNVKSIPKS